MSSSVKTMGKKIQFRRFFRSIFTRLIVIGLVAWFLILLTIIATFFISKHREGKPFYKNISLYLSYIVEDLGNPPDHKKALEISKKTGIQVSFLGDSVSWTTNKKFPDITKINFQPVHDSNTAKLGKRHGSHILRIETMNGLLFFYFAEDENDARNRFAHIFLIIAISAILFACYLGLKRVLQPLKWLETGVRQVAKGDLDHKVPVKGRDELTELSLAFNEMTGRVKEMINMKESLLRDVSHELRSPLTRMKLALEFIADKDLKREIEQDLVEMEEMIHNILLSAQNNHPLLAQEKEQCNISELVESIAKRYVNNPPGLLFIPSKAHIYARVNKNSLRLVCINLIENGLKFSSEQNDPVTVRLTAEEDSFCLTVIDSGPGISKEELPFIFEPFYRVDRSRSRKTGGYGLGLSLCKAVVEAQGGAISVKSSIGVGTEFELVMPINS